MVIKKYIFIFNVRETDFEMDGICGTYVEEEK